MCSKADLTFSDVSDVWMRNFWKMLERLMWTESVLK